MAAAVRVAAGDGLQAVSMGRVASDLGVSTMSLYRYVGAKDELLALMADLPFEPPPAPRGARGELARRAVALGLDRAGGVPAQPWVVRIPISGPPVTPNAMAWLTRLTDPERFPALHAVIAAGVFDEPDDGDVDFSFGLERVLDGIETLIEKRRTGRG